MRGNAVAFHFSSLISLLRFVPQVESFQRISCAAGALTRERGRESTLRNESGVDGMNKGEGGEGGEGGGGGDTPLSLARSLRRQTRVPCFPNYVSVASAAGS